MQMMFTAPAIIWSHAILHLIFGDKYPEAPEVLQALAPFIYLSGIAQLTTLAVNYMGEARRRVPIAVVMLTLNAAVDIVLLPRIGIVRGRNRNKRRLRRVGARAPVDPAPTRGPAAAPAGHHRAAHLHRRWR